MTLTPPADLTVECPRCGQTAVQRLPGPCERCRQDLRATMGGSQRQVDEVEYEPKMNVTPNAVASKD